jgi:hypothetical protein
MIYKTFLAGYLYQLADQGACYMDHLFNLPYYMDHLFNYSCKHNNNSFESHVVMFLLVH